MQAQGIITLYSSSWTSLPFSSRHTPPTTTTFKPVVLPAASAAFSISDADLASRGFRIHRTHADLDLDALNTVFARVGFPRREPAKILHALQHTHALIWLEDARRLGAATTGEPVAFARATGDGVFNAVVWDVVVDPSFQGIGLGRALMERLLDDLLSAGITNIALYAEPRVIGFYRPLGFAADPDGIKGMVYSLKKKQQQQQKKRG